MVSGMVFRPPIIAAPIDSLGATSSRFTALSTGGYSLVVTMV